MRIKKSWIVAGVLVGGLAAAGGTAFTTSATVPSGTVAGYNTVTASGGTVTAMSYTLDGNDPPHVTEVHLTTQGDTTSSSNVEVGFNGTGTMNNCGTGTYTTGSPGSTAYTCTITSPEAVSAITSTDVVIAD